MQAFTKIKTKRKTGFIRKYYDGQQKWNKKIIVNR